MIEETFVVGDQKVCTKSISTSELISKLFGTPTTANKQN
jgi:hypothetical protein